MEEPSEFELSLPARSENLKKVRHAVSDFAASLGVPDETIADLRLAVNEACSNVVRHAYGGSVGEMRVEAKPCGSSLLVFVRDSGHGLSRASRDPGTGLGLRVASAVSSSFAVAQTGEGTEVRLAFPLSEAV
jgi:anti-sigma regulatory factor (Ser/Thr protein kinase)